MSASDRELTEQELKELEERQRQNKPTLDQDIALRYDPSRLSKLVVKGAGRGEKLDLATRGEMERIIPGHDFGNVRVFRGPFAEEVTTRHKADAVTIANTGMILVRDTPRAAPGTKSGQALLAHELTHVAQAQRGMHFALAHEGGSGAHEHEAEQVEASVAGDSSKNPQEDKVRADARRRAIVERAIEMISEHERMTKDRSGGAWEG